MAEAHALLNKLEHLNVYARGDRRAPHKPLLLLLALGRVQRGETTTPGFEEAHEALLPLLRAYSPLVKASHQPQLPYWHLRSDGLWEVDGAEDMPLRKGGFPVMRALRSSRGRLPPEIERQLRADRALTARAARLLLDKHFPVRLHDSIASAVGLVLDDDGAVNSARRRRDPAFQREVMRAYEHRCVVPGFRAALDGAYFGVEAAHVRAHCWDGPDVVSNGLVLTPTLHKLSDAAQALRPRRLGTDRRQARARVLALHRLRRGRRPPP